MVSFSASGKGREASTLLGPLNRTQLNLWTSWTSVRGQLFLRALTMLVSSLELRTETDPFSKILRHGALEYRIKGEVETLTSSECYTYNITRTPCNLLGQQSCRCRAWFSLRF
jgi:hypothetical protein